MNYLADGAFNEASQEAVATATPTTEVIIYQRLLSPVPVKKFNITISWFSIFLVVLLIGLLILGSKKK